MEKIAGKKYPWLKQGSSLPKEKVTGSRALIQRSGRGLMRCWSLMGQRCVLSSEIYLTVGSVMSERRFCACYSVAHLGLLIKICVALSFYFLAKRNIQ